MTENKALVVVVALANSIPFPMPAYSAYEQTMQYQYYC